MVTLRRRVSAGSNDRGGGRCCGHYCVRCCVAARHWVSGASHGGRRPAAIPRASCLLSLTWRARRPLGACSLGTASVRRVFARRNQHAIMRPSRAPPDARGWPPSSSTGPPVAAPTSAAGAGTTRPAGWTRCSCWALTCVRRGRNEHKTCSQCRSGWWGWRARSRRGSTLGAQALGVRYSFAMAPDPVEDVLFAQQENVRRAFLHAWDGYVRHAWGADTLRPVSRTVGRGAIFSGHSSCDAPPIPPFPWAARH